MEQEDMAKLRWCRNYLQLIAQLAAFYTVLVGSLAICPVTVEEKNPLAWALMIFPMFCYEQHRVRNRVILEQLSTCQILVECMLLLAFVTTAPIVLDILEFDRAFALVPWSILVLVAVFISERFRFRGKSGTN